MASATARSTERSGERRVKVLASGDRARREVAIGNRAHSASVAPPDRSFTYTY